MLMTQLIPEPADSSWALSCAPRRYPGSSRLDELGWRAAVGASTCLTCDEYFLTLPTMLICHCVCRWTWELTIPLQTFFTPGVVDSYMVNFVSPRRAYAVPLQEKATVNLGYELLVAFDYDSCLHSVLNHLNSVGRGIKHVRELPDMMSASEVGGIWWKSGRSKRGCVNFRL